MRPKVLLLALRLMSKFLLILFLSVVAFLFVCYIVGQIVNDGYLAAIICFGILSLLALVASFYDIAKYKIDMENRDLMKKLSKDQ
jgi:hypothetical protein